MKKKQSKRFALKKSNAGLGLFAAKPIAKGDFVIEYTGKLIRSKDETAGRYLFQVNSRWTVDGQARKNASRYINHSCRPNCEPEIKGKKVLIYARKNIKPGEELAYNYGKEYFDAFIKPNGCRCEKCNKN